MPIKAVAFFTSALVFSNSSFLVKCIKDAKGDLTMKELFEKTNAEVKKATALIGKMQEPQYMVSPTWSDWADVKLKTPATMN